MKKVVFEYNEESSENVNIEDLHFLEGTITITFSETVENHVGMQKIGEKLEKGLTVEDLHIAKKKFEKLGYKCEYLNLNKLSDDGDIVKRTSEAGLLIVKNGVQALSEGEYSNEIFEELVNLDWDKKALMRGKVVNKHARWNLCFSNESQKADYENGQGTVITFKNVHHLENIRNNIPKFFKGSIDNKIIENLNAEGNYYYNSNDCYIGFHGDAERVIVIAIRLGVSIPLYYQWHLDGEERGKRIEIPLLEHGDLYAMSHKATGNDWKKRKIYTLRHAAGFNIPEKKID